MTEEEKDDLMKLSTEYAKRAMLYGCDAIQILASTYDENTGDSTAFKLGRGSWHVRRGLIEEFKEASIAEEVSFKIRGSDG